MVEVPEPLTNLELPDKEYRKRGFWIMVSQTIPVAIPVEPLGIYYATPVIRQASGRRRGNYADVDMNYMCEITTQYGDVVLNDYEYRLIAEERLADYMKCVAEGSYELRMYGQTRTYKTKLKEQIFYLQTRGIPYETAVLMVLGNIRKRNILYLQPEEGYQRMFVRDIDHYYKKRDKFLSSYNGPNYTIIGNTRHVELMKQYLNEVENDKEDNDYPDSE